MDFFKSMLWILLSCSFLGLTTSEEAIKSKTIALLVGAGDYDEDTSWDDLNSERDLDLVKDALMTQGVEEQNISLLKSRNATKEKILSTIRKDLIKKAKRGGTAIFHFSGHGQQVKDDNGDELDGLDEALVPVNSKKHFKAGEYEGEQLIRDDELEVLFKKLRKKLGPKGQLLVILDACHSGTGTRGNWVARGTDVIMAPPDYMENYEASPSQNDQFLSKKSKGGLAPIVALYSSSAKQLSYEYRDQNGTSYGLMSYAFSKALKTSNKTTSYQELFDKIKMEVSAYTKRQTPQAEGKLNQGVLNGKMTGQTNYFLVKEKVNASLVTVRLGTINSVYENSIVAFYPIGTKNISKTSPITTGKVIYSSLLECDVQLEENISKEQILQSWVYVTNQNYGKLKVKVSLDIGNESMKEELEKDLKEFSLVELVDQEADLEIQTFKAFADQSDLQIVLPDGFPLYKKELEDIDPFFLAREIRRQVLRFTQTRFLRSLEVVDQEYQVHTEFLRAEDMEPVPKEQMQLRLGEKFRLRITNTGSKASYFSVFSLQSDNVINPLIPYDRIAEEYYLEPGQQYLFEHTMTISPPIGTEVLKIILTPDPINLSKVIQTRGASTRGKANNHPLEVLISQSFLDDQSRGEETMNIPLGSVGVQTLMMEVIE